MNSPLSTLEKVPLREVWPHEASDFSCWLAEDENLKLLSDEIGIDITLIKREESVGRFSVDLFAQEEGSNRKVVIENQLEDTNHDHLGKIITYASGLNADIIIWIVKKFREEHKQAIHWLNEHTDSNINFFGIQMELWKIADSPCAPKFDVVVEPNDWAKSIKSSDKAELSKVKTIQMDFWSKLREYALNNGYNQLTGRKERPQQWYDIALGSSEAHIRLTVNTQSKRIDCSFYINNSKELFQQLEEYKIEIENFLSENLDWQELPNKKASYISLYRNGDIKDESSWPELHQWLCKKASDFKNCFEKYL